MSANKHLGEASFHIGADEYIVRLGVRELAVLETAWKVTGLAEVWKEANNGGHEKFFFFAKTVLSKHHSALSDEKIYELLDYFEMREKRRVWPSRVAFGEIWDNALPEVSAPKAEEPTTKPAPVDETTSGSKASE